MMAYQESAKVHGGTYHISSESDVMGAVIGAFTFAQMLNFGPAMTSEVATMVSELAMNIIKYAGHGSVAMEEIVSGDRYGIRVIASDRGPGIPQIEAALEEHFTTGGSLGMGLPGVKRMADDFQIDSSAERLGTLVTVIKWGPDHGI